MREKKAPIKDNRTLLFDFIRKNCNEKFSFAKQILITNLEKNLVRKRFLKSLLINGAKASFMGMD